MTLFTIVRRNVAERLLSSTLTSLSVALGVAVISAIVVLRAAAREGVDQSAFGYEFIVGAKGSPLQLVLNVAFHLDQSPGNVPLSLWRKIRDDRARVALAVPFAVGDSYEGCRIVGTTDAFLKEFEYQPGKRFAVAEGRPFAFSEEALARAVAGENGAAEGPFEAVLGARAARRTGLRVGSTFRAEHGTGGSVNEARHEESWTVVGILAPTGTPNDRAIFINLDSFYHIRGHRGAAPGSGGEISAVVVKLRSPRFAPLFEGSIRENENAMAVVPARVIGDLFETLGHVDALVLATAALVILVGGVSVMVSLYNSMSGRRRAIAILRAIGARRRTILALVLLEALFLCAAGGAAGLILGHALAALAARFIESAAGVSVSAFTVDPMEALVVGLVLVLGVLAGIVPALKAHKAAVSVDLASP